MSVVDVFYVICFPSPPTTDLNRGTPRGSLFVADPTHCVLSKPGMSAQPSPPHWPHPKGQQAPSMPLMPGRPLKHVSVAAQPDQSEKEPRGRAGERAVTKRSSSSPPEDLDTSGEVANAQDVRRRILAARLPYMLESGRACC